MNTERKVITASQTSSSSATRTLSRLRPSTYQASKLRLHPLRFVLTTRFDLYLRRPCIFFPFSNHLLPSPPPTSTSRIGVEDIHSGGQEYRHNRRRRLRKALRLRRPSEWVECEHRRLAQICSAVPVLSGNLQGREGFLLLHSLHGTSGIVVPRAPYSWRSHHRSMTPPEYCNKPSS